MSESVVGPHYRTSMDTPFPRILHCSPILSAKFVISPRVASLICNEIEYTVPQYRGYNKGKPPGWSGIETLACQGWLCMDDVFVHPCQALPTSDRVLHPIVRASGAFSLLLMKSNKDFWF